MKVWKTRKNSWIYCVLGYGKAFLRMISKQENNKEDWGVLENKNVKCMVEKPSTEGQINYKKYL